MALPVQKAADLAKDMAKKGIMGSISMGEPKDMPHDEPDGDEPMPEDDDHLKMVMQDIDALVPGLGKLVQEMCEKCMSKDMDSEESE